MKLLLHYTLPVESYCNRSIWNNSSSCYLDLQQQFKYVVIGCGLVIGIVKHFPTTYHDHLECYHNMFPYA